MNRRDFFRLGAPIVGAPQRIRGPIVSRIRGKLDAAIAGNRLSG